jgi:hypothetical protein
MMGKRTGVIDVFWKRNNWDGQEKRMKEDVMMNAC